jgi:hypothetical protein
MYKKKTKPGQNHIKQHKTPHTEHELETTTTKAKNKKQNKGTMIK